MRGNTRAEARSLSNVVCAAPEGAAPLTKSQGLTTKVQIRGLHRQGSSRELTPLQEQQRREDQR